MAKNNIAQLNKLSTKKNKAYRRRQPDPELDLVRSLIEKSGWSIAQLQDKTGMAYSTIANIVHAKTQRPQNATINMIARILGYERQWVKTR